MPELNRNTEILIEALFSKEDGCIVRDLFDKDCSPEALGCSSWSPKQMERIYFAILKLGQGGGTALEQATVLAKIDWRDLLMAAGFGEDLEAHQHWMRSICGLQSC